MTGCREEGDDYLDFESHKKTKCPLWAERRISGC